MKSSPRIVWSGNLLSFRGDSCMKNKMDLELFFSPVSMICPLVGRHGGETLVVEGGGFSALWGKVTSVFLHRGGRRPSFDDGCLYNILPQSTRPCISHDTMTLGHRIGTVQLSKRILTQPQHEFSDTGLESISERRLSP